MSVTRALTIAPDFAWSQSAVGLYLTCPRAFYLRNVERRPLDHVASGFAAPLGTGVHAGVAAVLHAATLGHAIDSVEIHRLMLAAFGAACSQAASRGEVLDDEGVEASMARLDGELFEWVMALAADRRVRAVSWTAVEEHFAWQDRHGRRYQGTIDAAGTARDYVYDFASRGMGELVPLEQGDAIVVDWKSGDVAIDHVSRALNVQLAFYSIALMRQAGAGAPRPRAFLARLSDVAPPKRPKDAQGEAIPSKLRELNPAWIVAAGLVDVPASVAAESNKKPRDPATKASIPKWLERDNPAFVDATSKPRGPVFYACDINFGLATRTIADAIRGAEAGLYPAAGAANGACLRCDFRRVCASSTATESTTTRTTS